MTALSAEPQRNSFVNIGWLCGYALFSFGCEPPTLSLFVAVTFWGFPVTPVPVLNSPRGLEAESECLGQTFRDEKDSQRHNIVYEENLAPMGMV